MQFSVQESKTSIDFFKVRVVNSTLRKLNARSNHLRPLHKVNPGYGLGLPGVVLGTHCNLPVVPVNEEDPPAVGTLPDGQIEVGSLTYEDLSRLSTWNNEDVEVVATDDEIARLSKFLSWVTNGLFGLDLILTI